MLEQAFLADIVENPEDDAPRLVYADWLDDQGHQDLAAFIRVQIQRSSLDAHDPRQSELSILDHRLLSRCQGNLLHRMGLPTRIENTRLRWVFRRGFPSGVHPVPAPLLLQHADVICKRAPLSELGLTHTGDIISDLVKAPWLSRLRGLALHRRGGPAVDASGLALLLQSPHLTRLVDLNLSDNDFDNRALDALRHWPGLQGLRRLWLSRNHFDGPGIVQLVQTPTVSNLRLLSLERLHLREQELAQLGRSPHLHNLEELDVSGCLAHLSWRGDPVLVHLADAGGFPRLRCLRYGHNDLGQAGIESLAAWPLLRILDLRGSYIGEPGTRVLAKLPQASEFQELYLKDGHLNDEGLAALINSVDPPLRVLDLRGNGLTLFGAAMLSRWSALTNLHTLRLGNNWIRARGVQELARSSYLGRLRRLDFSENGLGGEGVQELLNAPFLSQLMELTLDHNGLDEPAVEQLLQSSQLTELLTLSVRESEPFSPELRDRLSRRLRESRT